MIGLPGARRGGGLAGCPATRSPGRAGEPPRCWDRAAGAAAPPAAPAEPATPSAARARSRAARGRSSGGTVGSPGIVGAGARLHNRRLVRLLAGTARPSSGLRPRAAPRCRARRPAPRPEPRARAQRCPAPPRAAPLRSARPASSGVPAGGRSSLPSTGSGWTSAAAAGTPASPFACALASGPV